MTEEIIIDGVDVSECVSFDKLNGLNICCYDDTRENKTPFANFCVENKDCSHKQLKRKEQELTELKERFEKLKKSNSDYATAVLKRILKLEKIKEKWKEFIKMAPLEMAISSDKAWELDKIIEDKENV